MNSMWMELAWFSIGWLLGGFVNGITGFGAAMVAMPFVLLGMDITVAVPACSLMVLVVSLEQLWRYHDFTDWKRIVPILLGSLPGAVAGVMALRYIAPDVLKGGLGVFLVCYALWGMLGKNAASLVISPVWGYVAGFFSTAFGTAFSFNGPPIAVYATLAGWSKLVVKAGLSVCFVVTCIVMLVSQVVTGLHGLHTLTAMAAGVPSSIVGSFLGFRATRAMAETTYRLLLFLFIGMTGILFVWQSFIRPLL